MLFIDATKGLSGDMLLAAMMGILDSDAREDLSRRIESAAVAHSFECRVMEVEDLGVRGLGLSCAQIEPTVHGTSYQSCSQTLAHMEQHLGGGGPAGKATLDLIFEAEGRAHGLPPREVHLHEIGRPQALLNIAGIGVLAAKLREMDGGGFVASPIVTGRGIVVMSHGAVRVPAPVSEILLEGMMHIPGDAPGERATPTGIAAVKVLSASQSAQVPRDGKKASVGFGMKRFAGELGRTTLLMV